MSLSLVPLPTYRVNDPVSDINEKRSFAILKGGQRTSWKPIVSTSFSNSSATFTAPPPNPQIIVDRHVKLKVPVTIDFTGSAPVGQNLLQSGFDAFRAYPLSSNMNTLKVEINNTSSSINMADVIQALLRYHNPLCKREAAMSTTPATMDQSQDYSMLDNSVRNPLAAYIDSVDGSAMGRGGFPMDSVSNTNTTAQVVSTITEDLFLSPLLFGGGIGAGFIGVQTFQLIVNWNSDLTRMWSHSVGSTSTISTITVTLGQPTLLFRYITPSNLDFIPSHREYAYFEIQRYPTDINSSIASLAVTTISSQNIQLNSIPRMLYIFVRKKNSDLTFNDADSFFEIQSLTINWNNRSGLLSEASQEDLYRMSSRNGYNGNWMQWSAKDSYVLSGSSTNRISGQGSVIAVEFGTDIGLQEQEAPGLSGTYQLQFKVTCRNASSLSINPTLYAIIVSNGTFVIENNSAYTQIGVISKLDILNAKIVPWLNYEDLSHMAGASFLGDLRDWFSKAVKHVSQGVKKAAPLIRKAIPYIEKLGAAGYEYPQKPKRKYKKKNKKKKNYEHKGMGVLAGGKMIDRDLLRDRLALEYY